MEVVLLTAKKLNDKILSLWDAITFDGNGAHYH